MCTVLLGVQLGQDLLLRVLRKFLNDAIVVHDSSVLAVVQDANNVGEVLLSGQLDFRIRSLLLADLADVEGGGGLMLTVSNVCMEI